MSFIVRFVDFCLTGVVTIAVVIIAVPVVVCGDDDDDDDVACWGNDDDIEGGGGGGGGDNELEEDSIGLAVVLDVLSRDRYDLFLLVEEAPICDCMVPRIKNMNKGETTSEIGISSNSSFSELK